MHSKRSFLQTALALAGALAAPAAARADSLDTAFDRTFGTELRGGGLDESPHCYKDLQGVLDAHAGTIKILHKLRPIGVAMADTEDPYRD